MSAARSARPVWTAFSPRIWRVCRIRILILIDDGIGGGFGKEFDFHLGHVLEVLKTSAMPHVELEITTAHRQKARADIPQFRFDQHDLTQFSQIWIFGVLRARDPLSDGELAAITRFMEAGGGVFATGDHENVGQALAGAIPRVRSMRRWHWPDAGPYGEPIAPAQVGAERHDTVVDPNLATPKNEGRQDDKFPQTIRPRLYQRTIGTGVHTRIVSHPHPVLCGPDGPIRYLPDHMHEGVCEVPRDLQRTFALDGVNRPEYPADAAGVRLTPEVIAWGSSWNTSTTDFGVLCAYDGHRVKVGRVLVDSTWHHWFNINLIGFIEASEPSHAAFDPLVVPRWEAIQAFFRNVPIWLADRRTQEELRAITWFNLLGYYDVRLALKPLEIVPHVVPYYWNVGLVARDGLARLAPACYSAQWIAQAAGWSDVEAHSWADASLPAHFAALDTHSLETLAVGGAVHELADAFLPSDESIPELDVRRVNATVSRGAAAGAVAFLDWSAAAGDSLRAFADRLRTRL